MLPKKILLAEDDADDREFFQEFLKAREDIALFAMAENGEEVFGALLPASTATDLPDLIILDQNMPKRNGLQTVQALKEDDRFKNIPLFIYSTYADENLRRQSLEAGAVSVFQKPYTLEGYHNMVDAALSLIK